MPLIKTESWKGAASIILQRSLMNTLFRVRLTCTQLGEQIKTQEAELYSLIASGKDTAQRKDWRDCCSSSNSSSKLFPLKPTTSDVTQFIAYEMINVM